MRSALTIITVLFGLSLAAQCPNRDSIWEKLKAYQGSPVSEKDQLIELSGWLERLNNCPPLVDSIRIRLLRRVAVLNVNLGHFTRGIAFHQEAIRLQEANSRNPAVDPKDLLTCYYYLGHAYGALQQIPDQLRAVDSCIAIADRLGLVNRINLACLNTKVEHFYDVGDYYQCIRYASRAELLGGRYAAIQQGVEHEVGLQYVMTSALWRFNALTRLGDYSGARALLSDKLEFARKQNMVNYFGTIYSSIGELELNKGHIDSARYYFQRSLAASRSTGYAFNVKQTLNGIGKRIYFDEMHDDIRALQTYRAALNTINTDDNERLEDLSETLNIYNNIANVYLSRNRFDSAFFYYQKAFDQVRKGCNEETLLRQPEDTLLHYSKIHYFSSLMLDKADAWLKKFKVSGDSQALAQAVHTYQVAERFLNKIRAIQFSLESKLFWRADNRRLFDRAVEACYLQNNPEQAFYFFERSRAVLLNEQLNEQRWTGDGDILKQNELRQRLLELDHKLQSTPVNSRDYGQIETERFAVNSDLYALQQKIRQANPLYYQSFLDTARLSLRDVQRQILNNHAALMEMFAGDSSIYLLTILPGRAFLYRIGKASFNELTEKYIRFLSSSEWLNAHTGEFMELSANLYRLIFDAHPLPAGRIIISPDGKFFPFEALVQQPGDPPVYFLRDHAVSYTYSARFLFNFPETTLPPAERNFLGVAPVHFSDPQLPGLSGSDASLSLISAGFSRTLNLTGVKASASRFLEEFSRSRIVQLYTHATDSGAYGEPAIAFADSELNLSDLMSSGKPVSQLIVLSACNTGTGKEYVGEGVFSLNRGFAALGVPASIANLWEVDNQATYRITELFYGKLAKGLPPDVALQQAKLEFIQTAAAPERFLITGPHRSWRAPAGRSHSRQAGDG